MEKRSIRVKIPMNKPQLSSWLYKELKTEAYGYVFDSSEACPKCEGSRTGEANDFLLCHDCEEITAIVLIK